MTWLLSRKIHIFAVHFWLCSFTSLSAADWKSKVKGGEKAGLLYARLQTGYCVSHFITDGFMNVFFFVELFKTCEYLDAVSWPLFNLYWCFGTYELSWLLHITRNKPLSTLDTGREWFDLYDDFLFVFSFPSSLCPGDYMAASVGFCLFLLYLHGMKWNPTDIKLFI